MTGEPQRRAEEAEDLAAVADYWQSEAEMERVRQERLSAALGRAVKLLQDINHYILNEGHEPYEERAQEIFDDPDGTTALIELQVLERHAQEAEEARGAAECELEMAKQALRSIEACLETAGSAQGSALLDFADQVAIILREVLPALEERS